MKGLQLVDEIVRAVADSRGISLPKPGSVVVDPELAILIQRVEEEFAVKVLPQPHTFLRRWTVGGYAPSKKVVTLLVHPNWPLEECLRTLYHETGHILQDVTGAAFDWDTIKGYYGCERDADVRAFQLADAWGDGDLFPAGLRQNIVENVDSLEVAAKMLSDFAGVIDPALLDTLLQSFLAGEDFIVEDNIRPFLGHEQRTARDLAALIEQQPELFVDYDRSSLWPIWALTFSSEEEEEELEGLEGGKGPELPTPLEIDDVGEARQALYTEIRGVSGHWTYSNGLMSKPQLIEEDEGDKYPSMVTILNAEEAGTIRPFLNLIQALLSQKPQKGSMVRRATWYVTRTSDVAIYEIDIAWTGGIVIKEENLTEPWWRVLCFFGQRSRELDRKNEAALRLYVNSFRKVAGIYECRMDEAFEDIVDLLTHTSGPAPQHVLDLGR